MDEPIDVAALKARAAEIEANYQKGKARLLEERDQGFRELRDQGLLIQDIAEATGRSRQSISQAVNPGARARAAQRVSTRRAAQKKAAPAKDERFSQPKLKLRRNLDRIGVEHLVEVTDTDTGVTVRPGGDAEFDAAWLEKQLLALNWEARLDGDAVDVHFPGW